MQLKINSITTLQMQLQEQINSIITEMENLKTEETQTTYNRHQHNQQHKLQRQQQPTHQPQLAQTKNKQQINSIGNSHNN